MSLQALIEAGLNPHDAQRIAQTVKRSGALTLDDALVLAGRGRPTPTEQTTAARRNWWLKPAVPMEYKRLLDAKVMNIPDNPALRLTPLQAATQIVGVAKSAGQGASATFTALYRLWVEARDRYLDLQEDDGTLPPDIAEMTWGELCALYVKGAGNTHPDHPNRVLGVFLEATEG